MIELFIVEIVQPLKKERLQQNYSMWSRSCLSLFIVSITFQAKSLHEIEFLIGLSLISFLSDAKEHCFYFIIMTIDVVVVAAAFFIHGT